MYGRAGTNILGGPTLDSSLHTYTSPYDFDNFDINPWRAPGSAAVFSPCGEPSSPLSRKIQPHTLTQGRE